jgi:hypothetical protein
VIFGRWSNRDRDRCGFVVASDGQLRDIHDSVAIDGGGDHGVRNKRFLTREIPTVDEHRPSNTVDHLQQRRAEIFTDRDNQAGLSVPVDIEPVDVNRSSGP